MRVGTVAAEPGEIGRGWLEVTELPTGGAERLPVVLARGDEEGPTLWVTAGVHGDEVTGVAAAQDVLHEGLPDVLSGTLVCVPVVNPAGLRRTERASYYGGDDPNRFFPDPGVDAERYRPPGVQEVIDRRVYEAFTAESDDSTAPADALLDLHTAQVGSVPFVIRDRVLYGEARDEAGAAALAADLDRLASAFGLPVVNEYAAEEYTGESLQRSLAGAALNNAGVPAVTVELGSHGVVEEANRALGVAGCYRAMVELGMLDGVPAFAPDAAPVEPPVEYPVKRAVHPHVERAGVVRHRVEPGGVVGSGDVVADVVSPHGERRATVASEHDGFILGRYEGVVAYENDPLYSMAVRDDGELVVPRDGGSEEE
jgi:predicted deacylase